MTADEPAFAWLPGAAPCRATADDADLDILGEMGIGNTDGRRGHSLGAA